MESCPENYIGHHESDLYIKANDTTTAIIKAYKVENTVNVTTFHNTETKELCYDVAFSYDPFWDKIKTK